MPKPHLLLGSTNLNLGEKIASELNATRVCYSKNRFPDGEINPVVYSPVAGRRVFVIQSTGSPEAILELLLTADALRRARAREVIAVLPYYGYARADRRESGQAIGGALIARLLETSGVTALITVDLHNPALEAAFQIPVVNLLPTRAFIEAWRVANLPSSDLIIVAPDAGGVRRARVFSEALGLPDPVVLTKVRVSPDGCRMAGMDRSLRGKSAMLIDDIMSTGSTLREAAHTLAEAGAAHIFASVTHLVSTIGVERSLENIEQLFVSDSIVLPGAVPARVQVVGLAPLLADPIARFDSDEEISS